jgi:hypothetical protein
MLLRADQAMLSSIQRNQTVLESAVQLLSPEKINSGCIVSMYVVSSPGVRLGHHNAWQNHPTLQKTVSETALDSHRVLMDHA